MATPFNLTIQTVSSAFGTSATIPLSSAATVNGVSYLTFTLAGASTAATGQAVDYSILDTGASEIGTAIFFSSANQITTRTPTKSTNGNAAINASSAAIIVGTVRAQSLITFVTERVFTTSSGYTPNAGLLYAVIECVGGGGGGGSAVSTAARAFIGGGGGGAGYSRKIATAVTIGTSQTFTIGAQGTGGAAGSNNGTAGGDTIFGASICTAKGGGGGLFGSTAQIPVAGAGATIGSGDVTTTGQPGQGGFYNNASTQPAVTLGAGGNSIFGGGGIAANSAANGVNAGNYGAGGSGGNANSVSTVSGGDGSAGLLIITEYCALT